MFSFQTELTYIKQRRYYLSSVMTALTQVPFILTIYSLMYNYPNLSAFSLVYFISLVQLIALSGYLYRQGYYFLDVPEEARRLLLFRGFVHAIGYVCFVHSLKYVTPVAALCLQGTTCAMNNCVFRLRRACQR